MIGNGQSTTSFSATATDSPYTKNISEVLDRANGRQRLVGRVNPPDGRVRDSGDLDTGVTLTVAFQRAATGCAFVIR